MIGNDGGTLIGNDGSTLIGNDGGTLNQFDVASLIGNDSAGLIGNDGGTLINFSGGGNSIIGPAYSLQNGRLIGNDGSTLVGTDGASFAANAMASFRGFSAYTLTSFEEDAEPQIDTLSADSETTGRLDPFGNLDGELETAGDRDWVKIELEAGETYVITAEGAASGDGALSDPNIRLLGADGAVLGQDDDSGVDSDARLVFTATTDGDYYVEVSAAGDTGVGAYEVGVHSQPASFVKDGATIDNITGVGFLGETSITALGDGGFAIGFTSRIDGYWDFPFNQSFHSHVEIINAEGQVVDLDPRADYSTFSIYRGGDYNNLPGATEVVMNADGGYSVIVPNTYSILTGMIYRAVVAQGSELGLGPVNPLTPDSTPTFKTYSTFAVDIATLANGQYIASMGSDGIHGTDVTGNMVQISINGALPITIDTATGVNSNGQRTSVSALGSGAVVIWTDTEADPAGDNSAGYGVQGAIVDAAGNVLHTFDVNQTEARAQFVEGAQSVAELADGGFVVAWTSNEDDPNHAVPFTDCYFRVFNADGTPRTGDILLGDNQALGQHRPSVVGLPPGAGSQSPGRIWATCSSSSSTISVRKWALKQQ
ncbi:PPC domain-containing protein [Rhizobium sp. G21]|uniref:PPC domain-containing protein n=1 Tax=Rhizobium sp. G21 TaxID=2758439 RepID=UPI0016026177|nr:PPC domain-containing protein [Rhizobium sp. G21]MBB1249610.1 PPC domain-containing protein [Rhizobium sp. G21]